MTLGKIILARFGLKAPRKPETPDAFDLRLQRIGTREKRHIIRRALFKPQLQPAAA